jgi:hypothetical protein
MSTTLVIDALRAIDDAPNGLDRSILLQMQENIACDVMKIYRDDLARLLAKQKAQGVSPAAAAEERKDFFAQRLNTEYRNRAGANVFSLPMYLETAENRYRLEIRRHLQQVQDYIAHGKHVAETHYTGSVREMRAVDPGMSDMAAKVAAGLNGINGVLEKLSRIGKDAATKMACAGSRRTRSRAQYCPMPKPWRRPSASWSAWSRLTAKLLSSIDNNK